MNNRLDKIFAQPSFYEKNKDVDSFEGIYEAVTEIDPEIEKEELDMYLKQLSKELQNSDDEMSEDDLDNVSGGIALTVGTVFVAAKIGWKIGVYLRRYVY